MNIELLKDKNKRTEYINSLSKKEIKEYISKLKLQDLASKLILNAYYGAGGNKAFYFFNIDIAASVTLQGQNLIKYADKVMEEYFTKMWHIDKELHKKLKIDHLKINKIIVTNSPTTCYGDTDSNYVEFGKIIRSIENFESLNIDPVDFTAEIIKLRIQPYLNKRFNQYAESFNTVNMQEFKLEHISNNGVFIAKKNYILDVSYEDGHKLKESYLLPKGFDLVKSSLPKWAREKGKELIKIILKNGHNLKMDELINKIKDYKEEFKLLHPDDFSQNFNLRTYKKYVLKDDKELVFAKGASIYPRSAGYHNHLLYKQVDRVRKKYVKIRTFDKVRFYFCVPDNMYKIEAFSYLPGKFPSEFAPSVDYDEQFNVIILTPLNRVLEAMKLPQIEKSVIFFENLF